VKVERKLSDFSAEKWKRNENMKTETEFCGTETETEILWRKWNGNGTAFSGGTDAETETFVSD
jgi:hypothetical protein